MANKMYNNSFDTRKLQVEDDDWETDADFVNEDNIDNSKQQTQKQASTAPNYRASVIGKNFIQNAAPVDKTPSTPPAGRHINTAPSTYTPPGVFVSKKPAATTTAAAPSTNKPVAPAVTTSTSKPVSSVASKFSQPAQTTYTPPVKSTPVASKFSQPAPVSAPPVKSTPTPVVSKFSQPPAPVASPVKKPPPAPKRVVEPVYEEPVYEEPVQEEQYYEEPAQEQYYEEQPQEQYYEEPAQEQYYEEQQPADDQQYYEEQPAQDAAADYQQYPQAQALYDYVGEQEGDLSFYAGDIIYVYDTSDASGWYQGQLDNGTYGSFPSTFVQLL